MSATEALQSALGYRFKDKSLLEAALRHRSLGARHNERLEFLGDSVIGLIVSDALFKADPDASEGRLTRLRARLVRKTTLADVAREIGLGDALVLGPSAGRSGGSDRESILADGLEAVIAAVYLDADLVTTEPVVRRLLNARMEDALEEGISKDPKTTLQEQLQSGGYALPTYAVTDVHGEPHDITFSVACVLSELGITGKFAL
ncbi:MAG: ribonuclease III [Gammaproteobacteria bacterium]